MTKHRRSGLGRLMAGRCSDTPDKMGLGFGNKCVRFSFWRTGSRGSAGSPLMKTSQSHPPSRRDVVSAGGATLAVAASSPAVATPSHGDEERSGLRDPKDKFPKPPFERQSQPWPGLAPSRAKAMAAARPMPESPPVTSALRPASRHEEEEDAREVIDLIKKEGRTGLSISGDLRDEAFCKRLVDETVRGLGGIDILVMNAGRQQTRRSILDI
jgi:hypothetical protein